MSHLFVFQCICDDLPCYAQVLGNDNIAAQNTVYQCTPDIAISEACMFLQGSHTLSVFLDFFLEFVNFKLKQISVSSPIN